MAVVRIEQFDPKADEQRLRACYDLYVTAHGEDDPNVPPPSFSLFRGWWAMSFTGEPQEVWLATSETGELLGCYLLELPERENRENGFVMPVVAAGSRRRGIGTVLLAHAAAQAERAGRVRLMGDARVGSPGAAFAAAVSATAGLQEARRILDVLPGLHARLLVLRAEAEAHAAGYSLRRWVGATPDDLVASACALNEAMADAPHSDSFEPMTWDEARLREADARSAVLGFRDYSVAAIHEQSGDMAALTQITVDPAGQPDWAYQQLTAVTRAHRGLRLGTLVKIANLEWLFEAEPQIRRIVTFNAVQNQHMVAVNDALGHRVSDIFQSYEIAVTAAVRLPAPV